MWGRSPRRSVIEGGGGRNRLLCFSRRALPLSIGPIEADLRVHQAGATAKNPLCRHLIRRGPTVLPRCGFRGLGIPTQAVGPPSPAGGTGLASSPSPSGFDLLDAQDPGPARLVPEHLGEHPLRLPARGKELDHAVDLIADDGPEKHPRRLQRRELLVFGPSGRVHLDGCGGQRFRVLPMRLCKGALRCERRPPASHGQRMRLIPVATARTQL